MPRFNRFGRQRRFTSKPAVMTSTGVQAGSRTKCHGCGSHINVGDAFTRLRLQKRYARPCVTCSTIPKRAKRYHTACVPTDLNLAMGFDPNAAHHGPVHDQTCTRCHHVFASTTRYCPGCGHDSHNRGGAVPPPPKPKSAEELTLEAIAALEGALIAQVKTRKRPMTPELEGEFKKFQGIKAHILRGSNDSEQKVATLVGLQRLIKLVLA